MPITLTPAELETALGVGNAEAVRVAGRGVRVGQRLYHSGAPKRVERIDMPCCWLPATATEIGHSTGRRWPAVRIILCDGLRSQAERRDGASIALQTAESGG